MNKAIPERDLTKGRVQYLKHRQDQFPAIELEAVEVRYPHRHRGVCAVHRDPDAASCNVDCRCPNAPRVTMTKLQA